MEVIEDFKLKCRNSEGFFKENAALYAEIQNLKQLVFSHQIQLEEAQRLVNISNMEKSNLEQRLKYMVDPSELEKVESLLQ